MQYTPHHDGSAVPENRERSKAQANLAKLPPHCYSILLSDPMQLIRIDAGTAGFYPITLSNYVERTAADIAAVCNALNRELGVTQAQREAMESGSMFGWDIPAADPDTYSPERLAKLASVGLSARQSPEARARAAGFAIDRKAFER